MEKLKEIVKEILEIRDEFKLKKLKEDTILDCATRIFNSQNIQIGKEKTPEKSSKEKSNELLTEKQRNFLIREKYQGDIESLSKMEASALIDEYIKSQKGGENY